jgi:hypothetical protein
MNNNSKLRSIIRSFIQEAIFEQEPTATPAATQAPAPKPAPAAKPVEKPAPAAPAQEKPVAPEAPAPDAGTGVTPYQKLELKRALQEIQSIVGNLNMQINTTATAAVNMEKVSDNALALEASVANFKQVVEKIQPAQ